MGTTVFGSIRDSIQEIRTHGEDVLDHPNAIRSSIEQGLLANNGSRRGSIIQMGEIGDSLLDRTLIENDQQSQGRTSGMKQRSPDRTKLHTILSNSQGELG